MNPGGNDMSWDEIPELFRGRSVTVQVSIYAPPPSLNRSPAVCSEVVGWEDVAHQWEPDTGPTKETSPRFVNVRGVLYSL